MIEKVGTTPAAAETGAPKPNAAKIADAARQFESLLLAQILKSAHDSGGWLGTGEDQTASSALDMAEEQFAEVLSRQGGLGLTRLIVQGLEQKPRVAD